MVISRVMSLKEYLRYQAGLTIIPISDQWVNNPDCGTTNPSLFFIPKAAENMSCLEICECAVLAEKTGNRRILVCSVIQFPSSSGCSSVFAEIAVLFFRFSSMLFL